MTIMTRTAERLRYVVALLREHAQRSTLIAFTVGGCALVIWGAARIELTAGILVAGALCLYFAWDLDRKP